MKRSRVFIIIIGVIAVILLGRGLYAIFPKHITFTEAVLEDIDMQNVTSVEVTLPDMANTVVIEDPTEIQKILNSFAGLEIKEDSIENKTFLYEIEIKEGVTTEFEIGLYEDGYVSIYNSKSPQKIVIQAVK